MLRICILPEGGQSHWDAFVDRSPAATFFHLSGWRTVIERAFGHKTFYLTAWRGMEISGVLPLTQIRSRLFGNSLISNAFCVRGGAVADDSETAEALRGEAVRLGRFLNVGCVEFRSATGKSGWVVKDGRYANFSRCIESDDEKNLKAIPRKQRAVLRKALAGSLTSHLDEDVDRLHGIYAQSVRRLGTPVFSRRYFRLLKSVFGTSCEVTTVVDERHPIASVMSFYFRDQVLPYYGGGTEEARKVGGNDFLYWEVMRRAAQNGYRVFDFGRSKPGTGSYDYKRNWGFDPAPLAYEFLPLQGQDIPDVNPLNPKYRLAISLWSRLPLGITKVLGPQLVRGLG